jgi:hypothetical protein
LLEEQNVPVFCQLNAFKINPLIDVEAIESIDFPRREIPDAIAGIGFHPARAALRSQQGRLTGSPILNNIGYVVIVLKQEQDERKIPDIVKGNLTARIRYNINNAFGIGKRNFKLPELSDEQWKRDYENYGFWRGKGFLRVENIDAASGTTSIILYRDQNNIYSRALLRERQTQRVQLAGGAYCAPALDVRLDSIEGKDISATLNVDGDILELVEGQRFLENRCRVNKIQKTGLRQFVTINCFGSREFILDISPRVDIEIGENGNREKKSASVGDLIYRGEKKSLFVGYLGQTKSGVPFIIPVIHPAKSSEEFRQSSYYRDIIPQMQDIEDEPFENIFAKQLRSLGLTSAGSVNYFVTGGYITGKILAEGYGAESDVIKPNELDWEAFLRNAASIYGIAFFSGPAALVIAGVTVAAKLKEIFSEDKKLIDIAAEIKFLKFSGPVDKAWEGVDPENGKKFEDYFTQSKNAYQTVWEQYPREKKEPQVPASDTWGEEALWRAQEFAKTSEKFQTRVDLLNKFLELYPESSLANEARKELNSLINMNGGTLSAVIEVDGTERIISLEKISIPSFNEYGVRIGVIGGNTPELEFIKEQKNYLSADETITLERINPDRSAVFNAIVNISGLKESRRFTLNEGGTQILGSYQFVLRQVNLKPVVQVSIAPALERVYSETNFSFEIAVEKRLIQLNPEKTAERIQQLDERIAKWKNFSEGLGKVVKGLKTACLATGAALTVKNFISNLGGKSIARTQVMRGTGGWTERCKDAVSRGEFTSLDECYFRNSDAIDKDVATWQKIIEEQQSRLKKLDADATTKSFLGEKGVDTDKVMQAYLTQASGTIKSINEEDLKINNVKCEIQKGTALKVGDAVKIINYEQGWKNNYFSRDDARNLEAYALVLKDGSASETAKEQAKKSFCSTLGQIYQRSESDRIAASASEEIKNANLGEFNVRVIEPIRSKRGVYDGGTLSGDKINVDNGFEKNKEYPVQPFYYKGKNYWVILQQTGLHTYGATRIFEMRNGGFGEEVTNNDIGREILGITGGVFDKFDASRYQNEYKNPEVRYYETEPYKGLPAVVPFDLRNGWYAATKQTLPFLGGIKPVDESGRVTSFFLCNVGANGREEFERGIGDDDCSQVNLGIGQPYDQILELEEGQARQLVQRAISAIMQASEQYRAGVRSITIRGVGQINVGNAQVQVPVAQCQDVMSPKDCLLLFNVCDPVICPSSRCDLGGAYKVNDVVQSGIIGSSVLCLPNYRQGIFVPVCLTGIQAGIDGLTSIMQATRDCLQENLQTGRTVGICDEIQSFYMCELLWREATPIARVAIPKIIELATGQNVRGGGEYLAVQDSWNTAEKSIGYMRDVYGANAYKAFRARSTADVGGTICKAFVSAKYANAANVLDALTEPDSPSQYHAWFSEIPFTSATVPATSQYKVFYHIFAGKDQGAYYSVYLKSPPGIAGYAEVPRVQVATGYIALGSFASETIDFTAPAGYQELCISVNAQEECGFERVSTSFALNYIREKFLQEQASQRDIISGSACVSGTPSLYSLAQPNIQQGITDIAQPRLYDQGIVRVCSTENPGKNTDPLRWIDVGYCDNQRIRCWADQVSIANQIKTTFIENATLSAIRDPYLEQLRRGGDGFLGEVEINEKLDIITRGLDDLSEDNVNVKISEVDDLISKIIFNYQKAHAWFLKGKIYQEVAKKVFARIKVPAREKLMRPIYTQTFESLPGFVQEEIKILSDGGGAVHSATRNSDGSYTLNYITQDGSTKTKIIPPPEQERETRDEGGLPTTPSADGLVSINTFFDANSAESSRKIIITSESDEIKYNEDVLRLSQVHNLNFNLVRALIRQESGWNSMDNTPPDYGLMQITTELTSDFGFNGNCYTFCPGLQNIDEENIKRLVPEQNLDYGFCYLRCLREYYGFTDARSLVGAYNAGPSATQECKSNFNQCSLAKDFNGKAITFNTHVPNIIRYYEQYSGDAGLPIGPTDTSTVQGAGKIQSISLSVDGKALSDFDNKLPKNQKLQVQVVAPECKSIVGDLYHVDSPFKTQWYDLFGIDERVKGNLRFIKSQSQNYNFQIAPLLVPQTSGLLIDESYYFKLRCIPTSGKEETTDSSIFTVIASATVLETTITPPKLDSLTSDSSRQAILRVAQENIGESSEHCFAAVDGVYTEALGGSGKFKCVYAARSDEVVNLILQQRADDSDGFHTYEEYLYDDGVRPRRSACGCNLVCSRSQYDLLPGDLIQTYNGNIATGEHNLIFVQWTDSTQTTAYVYSQRTGVCGLEYHTSNLRENPITVIREPA